MNRSTLLRRTKAANDAMYYIYKHLDTDINIEELADSLGLSRFHLQRVFKDIFGRNIYESIKSIRLQKAANLLITNKYSTISEITGQCGYASQSSFNKVFRERFGMTPKEWRRGGYERYSAQIISASMAAAAAEHNFDGVRPEMVRMPEMTGCYIRHKGYGRGISDTWQKLWTWALDNGFTRCAQLGLHHDNPAITPLSECNYIACLIFEKSSAVRGVTLPLITIPGGTFAKFSLTGRYGDVLNFINWIYHTWFPASDYETTVLPPYAVYAKNHFLSPDGTFDLAYYVPVTYKF